MAVIPPLTEPNMAAGRLLHELNLAAGETGGYVLVVRGQRLEV